MSSQPEPGGCGWSTVALNIDPGQNINVSWNISSVKHRSQLDISLRLNIDSKVTLIPS